MLYRRHPEDLFDIRNRIIMDTLEDTKEKMSIQIPEGMKGITESAVHIVNRVNALFGELAEAIEKKNENLELRIKRHIVQILSLVIQICKYQMKDKEIPEKAKLVNICLLTLKAISEKAPNFTFEYSVLYTASTTLIDELIESQQSVLNFIESITTALKETLDVSVKNIATLSNISLKSFYSTYENALGKVTTAFFNCLAPIEILPLNLYRQVMGKLMDVVIYHVCNLVMKLTSIGPSEPENLLKFMKPLLEYERLLLQPAKGASATDVMCSHA